MRRPVPAHATHVRGDLHGRIMVITRPAGTAAAFARRVRQRGGVPQLLPGMHLHAAADPPAAQQAWHAALNGDALLFTSPAAVRFALALGPLDTQAQLFAVGEGTARLLRRRGLCVRTPEVRQDSEGVLDLPDLQNVRGRPIALIGAPGGRDLLREQLHARGAQVREVAVYQRLPPRLDSRHTAALRELPANACVLLSSAQAMRFLQQRLADAAWRRLCAAAAVVSSERLGQAARAAGFTRVAVAASAQPDDLLDVAAGT